MNWRRRLFLDFFFGGTVIITGVFWFAWFPKGAGPAMDQLVTADFPRNAEDQAYPRLHDNPPTNTKTQTGTKELHIAHTTIQLDFTPMEDPLSKLLVLQDDGKVRAITYNRYLLTVTAVNEGVLSQTDISSILSRLQGPAFQTQCWGQEFLGGGLSSGDLFYLSLKHSKNDKGRSCVGFLNDAPPVVRSLISNILEFADKLQNTSLADAYLKSEPITKPRFDRLRKSEKIQFKTIEDFSVTIQIPLGDAINRPRYFIPINREAYEQLSNEINAYEFFVIDKEAAYQLTIFGGTISREKGEQL